MRTVNYVVYNVTDASVTAVASLGKIADGNQHCGSRSLNTASKCRSYKQLDIHDCMSNKWDAIPADFDTYSTL